jgi:hypothetical protein
VRSAVHDILPPAVRGSLVKFGEDLARARRRRMLTRAMMAERTGVGLNTYARLERGDATVAVGAYAMALFSLGFGPVLGELADVRQDDWGLQLEESRLPRRVRARQSPEAR